MPRQCCGRDNSEPSLAPAGLDTSPSSSTLDTLDTLESRQGAAGGQAVAAAPLPDTVRCIDYYVSQPNLSTTFFCRPSTPLQ